MSVHRQTFVDLVQARGWTRGAELGVDKGILLRMLLDQIPALDLTGVDIFPVPDRKARVYEMALPYADRCRLLCLTTHAASQEIADRSLDFVFIDADHSERAVEDDIACWRSKVKAGGWIGGHDYHPRKWPGVVKAVDRAFGSRVQFWPGTIWGLTL